jgi:curli biogenesis system outer membrane secretion channel CsgG
MTRARRHFIRPLALTLGAIALSGCVSTMPDADGRYAMPIGSAPVISNETPYSRGLSCIAGYNLGRPAPRIAVGQIADYTGKEEADGSGRKITQGAALMAISALNKAGVRLVERFDTSVAELELKYANNKLISDDTPDYRKIVAGSIPGSDFYLVGGITELNYNIRSQGASLDGGGLRAKEVKGSLSANAYVMNVGLDLRLVDTKTLEVVDVISYQKQIVARQLEAGIFDVLGTSVVTAGLGDSALEPIQLAVRAVIERAVLEMISQLYDVGPEVCDAGFDPLGDPRVASLPPPPPPGAPLLPPPAPEYAPPPPAPSQDSYAETAPTPIQPQDLPPAAPPPAAHAEEHHAPVPPAALENTSPATTAQAFDVPPAPPAFIPAPQAKPFEEKINDHNRKAPYRWFSPVDANGQPVLRGGLL